MDRRHFMISSLAASLLTACDTVSSGAVGSSGGRSASELERHMLAAINQSRRNVGAARLRFDTRLNAAAFGHSTWMLEANAFRHAPGAGGTTPHQRMERAGFVFEGNWRSAENIRMQSFRGESPQVSDVESGHQWLMNSPSHHANIVNPLFQYVGIGFAVGMFDYNNGNGPLRSLAITQVFAASSAAPNLDRGR